MQTKDGFTLEDGEPCWVTWEGIDGHWTEGIIPYKAVYRSEHAKDMGWDFEIEGIEDEVEVNGVWHEKPDL